MPKGIKSGVAKVKVKTTHEMILQLPKAMPWVEGSVFMLERVADNEFKLVPYDPILAPAA
jgi:uncharacterized UPF0160 family protein